MTGKPGENLRPEGDAKKNGSDSGSAHGQEIRDRKGQDEREEMVRKSSATDEKPSGVYEKETGKAAASSFGIDGLKDEKQQHKPREKTPNLPPTEAELAQIATKNPFAASLLKDIARKREKGSSAAVDAEIDEMLKNAAKTFTRDLEKLRAQENTAGKAQAAENQEQRKDGNGQHPVPREERIDAMHKGARHLFREARVVYGKQAVGKLGYDENDVALGLAAYTLGPRLCGTIGKDAAKNFGRGMLVFGLAPMFGAADVAKSEFEQRPWETLKEGSSNFLTGSATAFVTELLNPWVGVVAGGVTTGALIGDQVYSPEHKARNDELLKIHARLGAARDDELLDHADRVRALLGEDTYKSIFSSVTSGLGLKPGKAAANHPDIGAPLGAMTKEAMERIANLSKNLTKEALESIAHLPDNVGNTLLVMFGHRRPLLAHAPSGGGRMRSFTPAEQPHILKMEPHKPSGSHEPIPGGARASCVKNATAATFSRDTRNSSATMSSTGSTINELARTKA